MTLTQDIVQSRAHLGTLKTRSHPKTSHFRAAVQSDLVFLEPDLVAAQLELAKTKIADARKEKKEILLVCEKKMYAEETKNLAAKTGIHYFTQKVPAGFLTNFETLKKRIDAMNELEQFVQTDDFARMTKKEQLSFKRKLARTQKTYEGVKSLKKSPDLVIVVDGVLMDGFTDEILRTKTDNILLTSSDFGKFRPNENIVVTNVHSHPALDFVIRYIFDQQ